MTLSPVSAPAYVSTFRDPLHGHYPSILPAAEAHASLPAQEREPALGRHCSTGDARSSWASTPCSHPSNAIVNRVTDLVAPAAGQARDRRPPPERRRQTTQTYGSLLGALNDSSVNRKGRLFVLIGRATFSAAANFAADVDRLHEGDVRRRADRRLRARVRRHRFRAAPEERDQRAHRGPLLGLRQGLRRPAARRQPRPQGQRHHRGLPGGPRPGARRRAQG